jgi:hypothetical protein
VYNTTANKIRCRPTSTCRFHSAVVNCKQLHNNSEYCQAASIPYVPTTGCLKMRLRKMRVLESAITFPSMENASTENVGTKVFSQDNVNTDNAGKTVRVSLRGMENASTE